MDLSGTWRAAPARDGLRRTFQEPDLDDRDWIDLAIPGHWAHAPELQAEHAVLHRRVFTRQPSAPNRRVWLRLAGVAQQGDVWLDGSYVGDTDGYFVPHLFEITDLLADRNEHVLAVDVNCDPFDNVDERTDLMGAFLDPELAGTGASPGGIWSDVTIHETGTSAIRFLRVNCASADETSARLAMRCVFDHPDGGRAVLRTTIDGHEHELDHPAAAGENRVEWTIDVADPDLWWPHGLGSQPLSDLRCELIVQGEVHDHRHCRLGLRAVQMRRWTLQVNGERLFTKGVTVLPTRRRPGDTTPSEVANDVRAARDAGFDLIRTIAHVGHPALYDTADEVGMLIWQDMPIRGRMARSVRRQAIRQAREMVDLLTHHPSIVVWCAHDEPFKRPIVRAATPPVLGQQRPSWNRAVLDTSVRRVLQRTDGSRPVVLHTGVAPHPPRFDGTTANLWFGWHDHHVTDLAPALARLPRMGRFVTAFGAATVNPELPALMGERVGSEANAALDWEAVAAATGTDTASLHRLCAPTSSQDGPGWAIAGQYAQAELVRVTIETLRRLKYKPTGGFCLHYLADPSPAGGFGLLDSQRRQKPGWHAAVAACQAVVVVVDPLPPDAAAGSVHHLDVHVVSDLQEPILDARVIAQVSVNHDDPVMIGWAGDIAPDSCSYIGHLDVTLPESGCELVIVVTLDSSRANSTNTYRAMSP